MAANDRDDERALEIRHQNKTTPTVIAVVVVAVVAVLFLRDPGGSFEGEPVTTTEPISRQTTTSQPTATASSPPSTRPSALDDFVPLRALGVRDDEVFVFWSLPGSLRSQRAQAMSVAAAESVTHAVATEELLVVRTSAGEVFAAGAPGVFRPLGCCWDALTPSSEPRHVWAIADGSAELLDLSGGTVITTLGLASPAVGPATFGLVTLEFEGSVAPARWHRPGFEPAEVPTPDGRRPRAAGGEVVAYLVDADVPAAGTVVEARRLRDGALVRSFEVDSARLPDVVLAPDGGAIAISTDAGTTVFDVESGAVLGELGRVEGPIVSIGLGRFATIAGDEILDSTGRTFGAFVADPLIIATRSG